MDRRRRDWAADPAVGLRQVRRRARPSRRRKAAARQDPPWI